MSIWLTDQQARTALTCVEAVIQGYRHKTCAPRPLADLERTLRGELATRSPEIDDETVDLVGTREFARMIDVTPRMAQRTIKKAGGVRVGKMLVLPRSEAELFARNYQKGERKPYGPHRKATA